MPPGDHRISLPEALQLTNRAWQARPLPVRGWSIDAGIIREILDQDGATGLRCYLGLTESGDPTLVFLATNQQGSDLAEGVLAEYARPCPPHCDPGSPFSSQE